MDKWHNDRHELRFLIDKIDLRTRTAPEMPVDDLRARARAILDRHPEWRSKSWYAHEAKMVEAGQ